MSFGKLCQLTVSGIAILDGIPHLVISNDKKANGTQYYALFKPTTLAVELMNLFRDYLLMSKLGPDSLASLEEKEGIQLSLPIQYLDRKKLEGTFLSASDRSDYKASIFDYALTFPVFLGKKAQKGGGGGGSKKSLQWQQMDTHQEIFDPFKMVIEYGVGGLKSMSEKLRAGTLKEEDVVFDFECEIAMEMEGNHGQEGSSGQPPPPISLVGPEERMYYLPFSACNFLKLRVFMSMFCAIHLQNDPELFNRVAELVRHSAAVTKLVYAPGANLIQILATMKDLGKSLGVNPELSHTGINDVTHLQGLLKGNIMPVSDTAVFAGRQLASQLLNFSSLPDIESDLDRIDAVPGSHDLNTNTLFGLLKDQQDVFNGWLDSSNGLEMDDICLDQDTFGAASAQVRLPLFLKLAGISCLLADSVIVLPACSCCGEHVKICEITKKIKQAALEAEPAVGSIGTIPLEIPKESYPVAFEYLFGAGESPSYVECCNYWQCVHFKKSSCTCQKNVAILLRDHITVQRILPLAVKEMMREQLLDTK